MGLSYNDCQPPYHLYYQAAGAANVVVKASPGFLYGVIVGADVGSGIVEISDSATDGDGNIKIVLTGDGLTDGNTYVVNAEFDYGITADITTQTHVTFIYK